MHVSLSVDSESAAVCPSAAKSRIHGELSIAALEALRHPKPGSCDGDKSTITHVPLAVSSHNDSSGIQESWGRLRLQPIRQPYRRTECSSRPQARFYCRC